MERTALLSGVCAFAMTATASAAAAQARPDFSGRWTSETETVSSPRGERPGGGRAAGAGRAGAARGGSGGRIGEMGSGWGSTITITQNARSLTVEYAFFSRGDLQPPLRFTYALDGSESKNTLMMGHGIEERVSRTSWDGDRLVITTAQRTPGPVNAELVTATIRRTLSLESPDVLVVEMEIDGVLGGPASSSRTVYRRSGERGGGGER